MPAGAPKVRIATVVEPVVVAAGYDLEEVTVSQAGRRSVVRVVVDTDGGVDLDEVAEVSKAISLALDEADQFGPPYTLEVTSPGVDRPLTLPRHWRRNTGRLVTAKHGDKQVTGRILDATDESVELDVDGTTLTAAHADLGPGRVQIEFNRPKHVEDAAVNSDEVDEAP